MLKLNATTFIQTIKDDPKDRVQIEVGDSKQPDFKPQVKIMRWDNEVNFSLRAQEEVGAVLIELPDGTIVYKARDYEVHQYDKPDASEEGGFEFEWVLKSKPATNVLAATIQTKGLSFFYQPPLTPEEIAEGAQRPENVEGSYAVYHSTKSNHKVGDKNYKCGKAFHIYRPKAIDANNVEVWADLNIDEAKGLLTVTVPQKFLDDAVYPLKIDPTFGYTTIGGTLLSNIALTTNDDSRTQGITYTLSEDGNITKISAALKASAASQSLDLFYAVYREDSAGVDSHDLVASAETLNQAISSTSVAFYDINFASESLTADDYILAALGNAEDLTSGNISIYGDAGASHKFYNESTTGAGSYATRKAENPWTEVDSSFNFIQSIYATYTASGGGAPATTANKHTLLMMGV